MITRKDLAPLNDSDFEFWENNLKYRQDKTLWALYGFFRTSLHGLVLKIILVVLVTVV
jgi:hypothetical protein